MDRLNSTIYEAFDAQGLLKRRRFPTTSSQPTVAKVKVPPLLKKLRQKSKAAHVSYTRALKQQQPAAIIKTAKATWNHMSSRCRAVSRAARLRHSLEWRSLWTTLRASAPRQLWSTFRSHTQTPGERIKCSPDAQFLHWSTQGEVNEPVWTETLQAISKEHVDELRCMPDEMSVLSPCDLDEIMDARNLVKPGRSPGHDGIPGETVQNLPCLIPILLLLFNAMLRSCVYPTCWGFGYCALSFETWQTS